MPDIFVTRRLPADLHALAPSLDVAVFEPDRAPSRVELIERADGARGLVTLLSDPVDAALLDALPELKVVANYAVGYDNIDVAACTDRGVQVTNTPDVLTEATADLAWSLILGVARRVLEGDALVRAGGFDGWRPGMLLGKELAGGTLGIYGFGRIGRAVARRGSAFGMRVLYTNRSEVPPGQRGGAEPVPLDELVARSDVLSLHSPLNDASRHAIDEAALASMKPDAILINTARGPVVDEAALAEALQRGHLLGAGLDVYEREPQVHPELLKAPRTLLLPHLGSATTATRAEMAEIVMDNAARVLRGEAPREGCAVNGPF